MSQGHKPPKIFCAYLKSVSWPISDWDKAITGTFSSFVIDRDLTLHEKAFGDNLWHGVLGSNTLDRVPQLAMAAFEAISWCPSRQTKMLLTLISAGCNGLWCMSKGSPNALSKFPFTFDAVSKQPTSLSWDLWWKTKKNQRRFRVQCKLFFIIH